MVAKRPKAGSRGEVRAAAVQLNSTGDYERNLEVAERPVRAAAGDGAELVVLPEKWTVLGDAETLRAAAQPLDGPALTAAAGWARELGIHLVAGSIAERVPGQEKLSNTSILLGPDERLAVYRKIHMFDVDVDEVAYRESAAEEPGDEIVVADAGGVPLGLTICYDLRFPELYRILALREAAVTVPPPSPSAPVATTGSSCCAPARSRTRSSSSPPTRSARHRRITGALAAR